MHAPSLVGAIRKQYSSVTYTKPPSINFSHLYCIDRISAKSAKVPRIKYLSAEFGPNLALFLRRQAFSLLSKASVLQQHSSPYS